MLLATETLYTLYYLFSPSFSHSLNHVLSPLLSPLSFFLRTPLLSLLSPLSPLLSLLSSLHSRFSPRSSLTRLLTHAQARTHARTHTRFHLCSPAEAVTSNTERDMKMNVARWKQASQSSTLSSSNSEYEAMKTVDMNMNTCSSTRATYGAWWQVDLKYTYEIGGVVIITPNRGELNLKALQRNVTMSFTKLKIVYPFSVRIPSNTHYIF